MSSEQVLSEILKMVNTQPGALAFLEGVRGAGKTSTLKKIEEKLKEEGNRVIFISCDHLQDYRDLILEMNNVASDINILGEGMSIGSKILDSSTRQSELLIQQIEKQPSKLCILLDDLEVPDRGSANPSPLGDG